MCPHGPFTLCVQSSVTAFLIWCDLYSMTITFLALVSLLPQQLTKLHQLAMQQSPFPPLGQTTPAFPGTYPAPFSPPLFSPGDFSLSELSLLRAVSRAGTALVNTRAGRLSVSPRWVVASPLAILWRDVCPSNLRACFPCSHVSWGPFLLDTSPGARAQASGRGCPAGGQCLSQE